MVMVIGVMGMGTAMAKRGPKPEVAPVEAHGLYFTVHPVYDNEGMVLELVARRVATGTSNEPLELGGDIVKRHAVFDKRYDLTLERDVQWTFATSLHAEGPYIRVVLENGKELRVPVAPFLQAE